jgi:hypothetical protein
MIYKEKIRNFFVLKNKLFNFEAIFKKYTISSVWL